MCPLSKSSGDAEIASDFTGGGGGGGGVALSYTVKVFLC